MRRVTTLLLALLLAALPLSAYNIYLKDGSRLIAREKYTLDGDRALIVLQNGTRTFLAASEIDVPRTEAANRNNYGTAMVLQDGEFTDTPEPTEQREENLGDLIGGRDVQLPSRPRARRPMREAPRVGSYSDLLSSQRQPFRDLDLAGEIQGVFMAQGVAGMQIAQGTAGDRILLEITTDSEASVFRALRVAADALLHVRTRTAAPISAFEIVLVTSGRQRAGQFLLTPSGASQLTAGDVEPAAFYVQNVQF